MFELLVAYAGDAAQLRRRHRGRGRTLRRRITRAREGDRGLSGRRRVRTGAGRHRTGWSEQAKSDLVYGEMLGFWPAVRARSMVYAPNSHITCEAISPSGMNCFARYSNWARA